MIRTTMPLITAFIVAMGVAAPAAHATRSLLILVTPEIVQKTTSQDAADTQSSKTATQKRNAKVRSRAD